MPDLLDNSIAVCCHHCGEPCADRTIVLDDKVFCCHGCKAVFELLSSSGLGTYYRIEERPGVRPAQTHASRYEYLDHEKVRSALLDYDDGRVARLTLVIPSMHCSSCIWLLENLPRLHEGILQARVEFLRRVLTVTFDPEKTGLRRIAEQLASLGYAPELTLESMHGKPRQRSDRSLYTRLGVAGFSFANVMLLSLPAYLAVDSPPDVSLTHFFGYLSLLLAVPVLLYSAGGYLRSAWQGLRQRQINMDVPIALGIMALFTRSTYAVVNGAGSGYLDSFNGLVFFLLIGKLYQQKTYDRMRFDRDYRSYFPISVIRKRRGIEKSVPLAEVSVGDRLVIRNRELIPADAVLISEETSIDYSFVTGESEAVPKRQGDTLRAGGRQEGPAIEVEVVRKVSQGYLTRLWNSDVFRKDRTARIATLAGRVSRYFTIAVLGLATAAGGYWWWYDPSRALDAVVAVLIVACPCALALSTPFALGTAIRLLGRYGCFVRNAETVEALAGIDSIVFDKTGTLTCAREGSVCFEGRPLDEYERTMVRSLASNSTHALSRRILDYLGDGRTREVHGFSEQPGKGIAGVVEGTPVLLGSASWLRRELERHGSGADGLSPAQGSTGTWLAIGNETRGFFQVETAARNGVREMLAELKGRYRLAVLSGDNTRDRDRMQRLFDGDTELRFCQTPEEKLVFVESLQGQSRRVLMVGDGLNDAGALQAAQAGMAVVEDSSAFSPASDVIIEARRLSGLSRILRFAQTTVHVITASFVISFLYNAVGLVFAVSGQLSPLVAAILMPASSLSVVLFATGATALGGRMTGLKKE